MESYVIYFGDREVVITTEPPAPYYATIEADTTLSVSRAKLIKKVETDKFIAIISSAPAITFAMLSLEFKVVRAAGGVVLNDEGAVLMIRLRQRWDLPKGHIEADESSAEAALREVEEETGVCGEIVDPRPIMTTWHAYDIYGEWELKSTDWWVMRSAGGKLQPQHDEGIKEVVWCRPEQLDEYLKSSYATINSVMERYLSEESRRRGLPRC